MIIILYLVPKSIKKKKLFSYVWLHHEKYKRKSNIIKIHQKFWYFKIIFNLYMIEGTKWNEYEKIYKNNLLNLNLFFYFPFYFLFFVFFLKIFRNGRLEWKCDLKKKKNLSMNEVENKKIILMNHKSAFLMKV